MEIYENQTEIVIPAVELIFNQGGNCLTCYFFPTLKTGCTVIHKCFTKSRVGNWIKKEKHENN